VDDRARALADVATLVRQHGLSMDEIAAAVGDAVPATRESRVRAVLVRVLGYLGGTFVFAGIGVFIAVQWDSMNAASRVVVTLGSGLTALILGVLAARDARFDKATTPMLLIAAALQPTGMLVAFNEYGSGGDWRYAGLVTCAVMAAQFAGVFWSLGRSTPLFMTIFFGTLFWWTAFDLVDLDNEIGALALGGSVLLAAVGVDRTPHRVITPSLYLFGAMGFLYGLFDLVDGTVLEIVFIGATAGFVYLSVVLHSRMLLFVATAAILAYTGWFTSEHFADSIGWPIALILFGMVMIGLSALALRIDRDYVRVRENRPA
jgi:hypothetical protein